MGANLGLILGAGCGLAGGTLLPSEPMLGLISGLVIGIAIGGALNPLLRPRTTRKTIYPRFHYTVPPLRPSLLEEEEESEEASA